MKRSTYRRSSPNAAPASLRARPSRRAAARASSRASLIPRPPPPPGRLDQQRVAESGRLVRARDLVARGGPAARLAAASSRARSLSPASSITSGRRPDEHQPVLAQRAAASRGFSDEEAVAGMDRITAGPERRLHDRCRRAGSSAPPGRADARRRDRRRGPRAPSRSTSEAPTTRLEPELAAGAHDPQRDLAAVGDEHRASCRAAPGTAALRTRPARRSRPRPRTTVPDTPAGTEFIIFMTSMMQTIVSGSTVAADLDERRLARAPRRGRTCRASAPAIGERAVRLAVAEGGGGLGALPAATLSGPPAGTGSETRVLLHRRGARTAKAARSRSAAHRARTRR